MKIFEAGMVKNGCGQSDDGILKFTVTEELIDGINWFFACLYMIQKVKADQNFFGWVWSQSSHRTLKLTVSPK